MLVQFSLSSCYTGTYKNANILIILSYILQFIFALWDLLNAENCFLRWLKEYQCFLIAAVTFCPNVSEWLQALKCACSPINMTWMSGAETQALGASRDVLRSSASFRIWKKCRSRSVRMKGAKPSLIFWYLYSFEVDNFCSNCSDLWILRYSLEAA